MPTNVKPLWHVSKAYGTIRVQLAQAAPMYFPNMDAACEYIRVIHTALLVSKPMLGNTQTEHPYLTAYRKRHDDFKFLVDKGKRLRTNRRRREVRRRA